MNLKSPSANSVKVSIPEANGLCRLNRAGIARNFGHLLFFLALLSFFAAPVANAANHHDLSVRIEPGENRLVGEDRITLESGRKAAVVFYLSPKARIDLLTVDGIEAPYTFRQGQLHVPLPRHSSEAGFQIQVAYTCRFLDPVPDLPLNTDNPGYGVAGTISEKGTFLLAGSGWYPHLPTGQASFRLAVDAPEGILAVTAGRSLGHGTRNGRTISTWEVNRAVEGLALSAGPYVVTEIDVGGVVAATYFFKENQHLSTRYLEAVAGYLRMYSELFGPYPFEKFAVVENFFPTGYGFPSYTLIGGRVLRLPFIIYTSLGHEIAHCWWGNGVLVDYENGNWSEGLTAYVSDYRFKELQSEKAAFDHRRQMLRNYATLVDTHADFPLTLFRSRFDKATQAVGYDKSAMVFHMIRQRIGEDAFWAALRDLYREQLFQKTSWDDLRVAFERQCPDGCDLRPFFNRWVFHRGAPELALKDVTLEQNETGHWTIKGTVAQEAPVFELAVTAAVETDSGQIMESIPVVGKETSFAINVTDRPNKLVLDPGANLFRRLDPQEIPPAVNSLKGSSSVILVIGKNGGTDAGIIGNMLIESMGLEPVRPVREAHFLNALLQPNDFIVLGYPDRADLVATLPEGIEISADGFAVNGLAYNDPAEVFFGVFPHPVGGAGRVAAFFLYKSPEAAWAAARKITHYGRYSYLVFKGGRNIEKGTWPVEESPLIYRFPEKEKK